MTAPLIMHVIHRLDIGGLENGLVNLINNMPVDKYRHAIICMTESSDFGQRIESDDVKIYELYKKEGQDFSIYPKMMRIFRETKPDIVHSKNFSAIEAILAAFLAGIKFRVHSEHGRDIDDIDGKLAKRVLARRMILLFAQKCIPLSKNLAIWLTETIKVPKKKLVQLYNGVDIKKFDSAVLDTKMNDMPALWHDRIIIGTVGRLEEIKDQKTLLLGYIKLLQISPKLKNKLGLIIVGDGSQRKSLEEIASTEGVGDSVWFAGARNNVNEFYACLDIFVLPSLNEGISNTILEAMASSLPVVATSVGGNAELVVDDETGKLVPPNNPEKIAEALLSYVDDMALARIHGKSGRQRVETLFSMDKMIENYVEVYDSLITKR